MQLPPADPETLCEALGPDLPPETVSMARALKALARGRKINTSAPLLRVVWLSWGVDQAWRAVAGLLTALYEPITEQAVAARLRACGPWVQAVRRKRRPPPAVTAWPQALRCVGIDATTVPAPGATGTDDRLHLSLDWVTCEVLEGSISEVQTGATLQHCSLGYGDVALTDRGDGHPARRGDAVTNGAQRMVCLQPFRVVLGEPAGQPLALGAAWQRPPADPLRTLEVVSHAASGADDRKIVNVTPNAVAHVSLYRRMP